MRPNGVVQGLVILTKARAPYTLQPTIRPVALVFDAVVAAYLRLSSTGF